jgi:hypothetical protein
LASENDTGSAALPGDLAPKPGFSQLISANTQTKPYPELASGASGAEQLPNAGQELHGVFCILDNVFGLTQQRGALLPCVINASYTGSPLPKTGSKQSSSGAESICSGQKKRASTFAQQRWLLELWCNEADISCVLHLPPSIASGFLSLRISGDEAMILL